MRKIQLFVLMLVVLWPALSLAQQVPLERVVEALETPFRAETPARKGISAFEAKFHQQSVIASLEQMQEGGGRMQVKFAGAGKSGDARVMFRWVYSSPSTQEIVSDGDNVWVYMPENQQVLKTSLSGDAVKNQENPMIFLTGLGNLSQHFTLSWASPNRDEQGDFLLSLQPKNPSTMVQNLQLAIAKEAVLVPADAKGPIFPLVSVHLSDGNGNSTRIEFSEVRVNPTLPDKLFEFQVPEGVEIVSPQGLDSGF